MVNVTCLVPNLSWLLPNNSLPLAKAIHVRKVWSPPVPAVSSLPLASGVAVGTGGAAVSSPSTDPEVSRLCHRLNPGFLFELSFLLFVLLLCAQLLFCDKDRSSRLIEILDWSQKLSTKIKSLELRLLCFFSNLIS